MNPSLACPKCQTTLLDGVFNQPDFAACPQCKAGLSVEVFHAFFRKIAPGQSAQAAGEIAGEKGQPSRPSRSCPNLFGRQHH